MDRSGSGLRRLTGLLLALNAGVLLVGLLVHFWPAVEPGGPGFNADKIRVLSVADAARTTSAPQTLPESKTAQAPPEGDACLHWERFGQETHDTLERLLKAAGVKPSAAVLRLKGGRGWWVFLSPAEDAAVARKTLKELSARKIKEAKWVRRGVWRNAISLGAFTDLDQARAQAAAMTSKGLKDVRLGPRQEDQPALLDLSGSLPADRLARLARESGAEYREGACEAAPE